LANQIQEDFPFHDLNSLLDRWRMDIRHVVFAFFIVWAAALNLTFFIGDIARPELHNIYNLFAAIIVNLIATAIKFNERTAIGATHLSTSLVADLLLFAAVAIWFIAVHILNAELTPYTVTAMVSMSGGALLANIVSVVMLIVETVTARRSK
jgi:hypothetical protein